MSFEIIRTTIDENGDEIVVKKLNCSFESGTLNISEVRTDENGEEVLVLVMVQPWKCNGDGTNEPFKDADDAFKWAEESTHIV